MAGELPPATPEAFYRRVNRTLERIGFAGQVWAICEPADADPDRGGRPGIDPVVYLKMHTGGFFEDLPSERAIASRGADRLSIRGALGYSLTEATPDHSSRSVIRERLGIDSSVLEANARLRALEPLGPAPAEGPRNTEESDGDYGKRLAAEAGLDPSDTKAGYEGGAAL